MVKLLRSILSVLTAVALLGAVTAQVLPASQGADASMPCAQMADAAGIGVGVQDRDVPCKGITLTCLQQMGCIGFPSLPMPAAAPAVSVVSIAVAYWPFRPALNGVSVEPDLFPPITG